MTAILDMNSEKKKKKKKFKITNTFIQLHNSHSHQPHWDRSIEKHVIQTLSKMLKTPGPGY